MHKTTKWVKWEDNRTVYNRVYKHYLDHRGMINCSWCRYHKGENASGKRQGYSWKRFRKTQYR